MSRRSLLWLLFVLLGLAVGLMPRDTQAQFPTATPTLIFTSTPAPTLGPTVFFIGTPQLSPTPGCAPPLGIVIGGTAYVSGGVYVRTQPTASSPFVNYYAEAVEVRVIGGPICESGTFLNWWQVRGPGNDGWVAEGKPGNYWMRAGEAPEGTTCSAPATLTIGGQTTLRFDVRVRQEPGLRALVLTVAPANAVASVLDGPRCQEGYNWWRVRVEVLGIIYEGWMADFGEGQSLLVDPAIPTPGVCDFPLPLSVGMRGYVNYPTGESPKNMRVAPDTNAEIVATLIDGIGFEIIGGSVCAGGYNWWQIRILSRPDVTGWFAEGGPQGYWIQFRDPGKERPL